MFRGRRVAISQKYYWAVVCGLSDVHLTYIERRDLFQGCLIWSGRWDFARAVGNLYQSCLFLSISSSFPPNTSVEGLPCLTSSLKGSRRVTLSSIANARHVEVWYHNFRLDFLQRVRNQKNWWRKKQGESEIRQNLPYQQKATVNWTHMIGLLSLPEGKAGNFSFDRSIHKPPQTPPETETKGRNTHSHSVTSISLTKLSSLWLEQPQPRNSHTRQTRNWGNI